jgi:hypothetical protein
VPFTAGFGSPYLLTLHFVKHGPLLGAATEAEYLQMADIFLGGPFVGGVAQCTRRSDHDRLRFHESTQRFGVLTGLNVIRTFYRFGPPRRDSRWFQMSCAK